MAQKWRLFCDPIGWDCVTLLPDEIQHLDDVVIPFPHQYDLRMYGNEVMDFTVFGIAFDVKDRLFKLGAHSVN